MAFNMPVFNERAADLRALLIDNGENLPLLSDEGSYFAYKETTIMDAVNVEKSSVIRFTAVIGEVNLQSVSR